MDSLVWWRALLAVVGVGFFAFAASTLDAPARISEGDARGVAIVTLPCNSTLQANSTGFIIDDRTVVTVAHALYGSRDHAVRDALGRWHRGEIVRLDVEDDIAVLHIEDLRATPLASASGRSIDAWVGTPVTMIAGSASGTRRAEILRRVRISTDQVGDGPETDEPSKRSGYELALSSAPGDSGAALLDDQGNLVAMVFARSTSRDAVSWATAADEIDPTPGPVATWACHPGPEAEIELGASEPRLR